MRLFIDTCSKACSVALLTPDALFHRAEVLGTGHAEKLPAMIDVVLKEAAIGFDDLDGLGINLGPGSFAGVRVGVASVRALAMTLDIPIFASNGFEVLASDAIQHLPLKAGDTLAVLFDARRDEIYAAYTTIGAGSWQMSTPEIVGLSNIATYLSNQGVDYAIGSGAALVAEAWDGAIAMVDALPLAEQMATYYQSLDPAAQRSKQQPHPSPLYLRPPDAKPGVKLWETLSFDDA